MPSPTSFELTPYRLGRRIGAGGMGDVFEAEHVRLGKAVVVKVLHEALADAPGLGDRMRLEAQILAAITTPHLVQVLDLGRTSEGRPYFVMERLQGRTLREELAASGPLTVRAALELTRQMLLGLEAAHAAGIVHRDVKLANVFFCDPLDPAQGRIVKVLDFGIAKLLQGADPRIAPLALPTASGFAIGTPEYFSPEQARGEKVDARTDVYSAGVVLYMLLTGRGPFTHRRGIVELVKAHVHEAPEPPSAYRLPLAPIVDGLVLKALEKAPEKRYGSAAEFAAAIARLLGVPSNFECDREQGAGSGSRAALAQGPGPDSETTTRELAPPEPSASPPECEEAPPRELISDSDDAASPSELPAALVVAISAILFAAGTAAILWALR